MLRLCAGLLPLRAGEAEVLGVDLRTEPRRVRRAVALVGHETFCYDDLTVAENVLVGRQAHRSIGFLSASVRWPSAAAQDREDTEEARRLLRLVGLEEWAERRAADLPAGLRRLLEIARALATGPTLLLLDEPAAGLNASETESLSDVLRRIRDRGVTIVVVEHDMGLVMDVSDEIVVLDRGAKIAEGPPRMIQKDPAVIAAYLGEGSDA